MPDHRNDTVQQGERTMTATADRSAAPPEEGRYRLTGVARMEWIKLRSLRSTWWTLAVTAAGTIGIGVAVGANTVNRSSDLTNNALAGVVPGLLLAGALGVLTMTSEYSSGMIRATLAAVPRRPLVLAGKVMVFGAVALVLGEVASFASFWAGSATLGHGIPAPALGQPGVLRAVMLSGTGFCLIGLLGLGLGAIIRHSAAALGVLVGGVYVLATFIANISHRAGAYTPIIIVGNSLSTTKPETCGGGSASCHVLSAWTGLGVLCLWAAVPLLVGGWMLARRDA
jgi:ABC-2 type transport system permease protein